MINSNGSKRGGDFEGEEESPGCGGRVGRSSMSNRHKKRGGNVTSADTQITQLLLAASEIF